MSAIMQNLAVGAFTLTAGVMAWISWQAWSYRRNRRVLFLAIGFTVFLLKGIVLTVGLFSAPEWAEELLLPSVLFDLAVLSAFYAAVLQRPKA